MNRKFYRDMWLLLLFMSLGVGVSRAGDYSDAFLKLQEKTITGQVVSADGDVLPGVNVVIKGTTSGTVTDADGRYTLNVADGNTVLVFSFIGFAPEEVVVGTQSVVNIVLTPSLETLTEVVVIGYGTVKKTDLTGSVSSVKADELRAVPTTSFDQALQGRAAGVQVVQTSGQPGAESSIRIRGISSIKAFNEPLYVIDGMLMNSNTNDVTPGGGVGNSPRISPLAAINPNDIESIDILKDASATAMYGSRGTNGVVLITTRRGKKGTNAINFETYYAIQEPSKKLDLLDASQYAEFVNEARINSGQDPVYVNPQNLGRGTDWQEEIFRTAPMRNYQLSFSGGTDKTQYVVSGGYFDQEGIVINTDFRRYSFRTNLNTVLSKKFSVATNLMYAYTSGSAINTGLQAITPGVIGAALGMNPILPVYDPNVNGGYTYDNNNNVVVIGNPVAEAREHAVKSSSARILGNVEARYKILESLEFKSSLGIDATFAKDRSFAPAYLKSAQGSQGEAGIADLDALTWLNENTLTFNKDVGEKSNINAVVGYTSQEFFSERMAAYVFGIADPRMGYHNLAGALNPQPPSNGETKWSMTSYLGRVQYALNGKYIFTATGRVDGSSKFARQNRYGFFPSGAAAWRISEESFMQEADFVSDLKLRSSIGIIGNQAIGPYESLALVAPYGQGVFNNGNTVNYYTANQPTSYNNPDLKWETTRQFNIGLDAGFLQNRIQITADYFQKYTYDLLLDTPIPVTNGFSNTVLNIGNMTNRGFDIDLRTVNTTGAVKWNTSFNISRYRNEVTKLATGKDVILGFSSVMLREGEPIGTFYGYQFDGIFQSDDEAKNSAVLVEQEDRPGNSGVARAGDRKYKDLVEDGVINPDDRAIIGHALPDFTWGLNNSVSYRNFTLSLFIQGSQGNDMANFNQNAMEDFRGVRNVSAKAALNRWTPENASNRYPSVRANRLTDVGTFSSVYVEDASYIRFKNITLGYDLPSSVLERIKARSLRLYISATNLVTITDYSGYDPEGSSYGTTTSLPGVDQGRYPLTKTYLVGLNIGF